MKDTTLYDQPWFVIKFGMMDYEGGMLDYAGKI